MPGNRRKEEEMRKARYYLVWVSNVGDPQIPDLPGEGFGSVEEALKEVKGVDIERDRILIWEVLPTGHMKVVWQFSGWHWPLDAIDIVPGGLDQGSLPGDKETLYEKLSRQY